MEKPIDSIPIEHFRKELQNNGPAESAAKIRQYLDKQDNIPLNIAITGESGSGKSTFVNAFRGVDNRDEEAAPTGCVETTLVVTAYPHPHHPNVTLWDLPGIGTTKFPADKYLEQVGFKKYDFFIIILAERFRENNVKLAQEIQRMGKKFYFVRSKIDVDLKNAARTQRDFNEEKTLEQIRENCIQGLQGIESPQVFLVSSLDLHLYDFHQLEETLERELPAHKKNILLNALPIISSGIIEKKKEALKSEIKWVALMSALVASVPVPGLSFAVDVACLVRAIRKYQVAFELDEKSLEKLAHKARVSLDELKAVTTSHVVGVDITEKLAIHMLQLSTTALALMEAEEAARFIPLIGIPVAMGLSFTGTYLALSIILNRLAGDAKKVFTKALASNTKV